MWSQAVPTNEALAALDPYLEFAVETNYDYFYAGEAEFAPTRPVVIELRNGRTAKQFAIDWEHTPGLRIPTAYQNPPAGLQLTRFCTAEVTDEFFARLANPDSGLGHWVKRIELSLPIQIQSADVHEPFGALGFKASRKVVTAIIDDGLAFANEAFRVGAQARIEYLWRQDGVPGAVPGFGYGSELRRIDIEAAIGNAMRGRIVDEDEVYRATRQIDFGLAVHKPTALRGAHGTHVMRLATHLRTGVPPADRPIIGVQLPTATTADTSGGSLAKHVLDGLRYIIDRADAIAASDHTRALPIVVNLSYGLIAGPHDGSSILEAGIDELIAQRRKIARFAVVLPAGNSYLARCHAQFALAANGKKRLKVLRWRVQPDDRTPSFMEIWLPARKEGRSRVEIQVTPPSGQISPWVQEGELFAWQPRNDILCKVIYFDGVAAGRKRNMILIALAPTSTLHPTRDIAPSGVWRVAVRNAGPAATIDAWIQRDDAPYGYPRRGRQSYFDDPDYVCFDNGGRPVESDNPTSYVKREGTINAIATGRNTIVVGGSRRSDLFAARYSAAGPVIHPPGRGAPCHDGPDAMAMSEDSVGCHGVLAAGTRSGSVVAMNGTSVAAPTVARWVANRMAAGAPYGRTAVAQAASTPPTGTPSASYPPLPRRRAGAGRIKLRPLVDRRIEK